MTVRHALIWGSRFLSEAGHTSTPHLDSRILLGYCTNLTLEKLLVKEDPPLSCHTLETYHQLLQRRAQGYPVAWLVGTKEFMGLNFSIEEGILVPRPETETLVEVVLNILKYTPYPASVLDVCCGSGCVGIAVAVHSKSQTGERFTACDISSQAVEKTLFNAQEHGLYAYKAFISDLLSEPSLAKTNWDLIVSNPPYLTSEETRQRIEQEYWKEPDLALDGGAMDGLKIIRKLISQASYALAPKGYLVIEASPSQGSSIIDCFSKKGFCNIQVYQDLAGHDRVFSGQRANLR